MNRTELIAELMKESQSRVPRGNTLWVIKNGRIVEYDLFKKDGEWESETRYEDSPPLSISCPLKYLGKVPVLNPEWRKKVTERKNKLREINKKIRSLFNTKEKGEQVKVYLQPKPGYWLNVDELVIVIVHPTIQGIASNGKRYTIPLRLVDKVERINLY